MSDSDGRFDGMGRLLGVAGAAALGRAHVCVVGIGGVGSWTVEALARSGIGALTLVDLDEVCVSNANRQLHALDGNVGRFKVEVMAERVARIHPGCQVHAVTEFFTQTSADHLLAGGFDMVVDAIDSVSNKALLIGGCRQRGLRVVTVGGAGGRTDPCQVRVADLNQTMNDGLLRRLRSTLRQRHDFPRGRDPWGIPAVFSLEPPVYPMPDGGVCERVVPGNAPRRLDCADGYGAASFVTGTFGFAAAAVVVRTLAAG